MIIMVGSIDKVGVGADVMPVDAVGVGGIINLTGIFQAGIRNGAVNDVVGFGMEAEDTIADYRFAAGFKADAAAVGDDGVVANDSVLVGIVK